MGGCVVPPGTAAMCQTGGEEEKGSEWAGATEGGREREGRRRKREKNVWGGGVTAWLSFSCQSITHRSH